VAGDTRRRCSLPSPSWLRESTGINNCLTKPISRASLRQVLKRYCPLGGKVLVIDDDPGFVSLETRMLHSLNPDLQVTTAHTGAQGLRLARRQPPDLVLLDLLMPDMDGFQVVRILRSDERLRHIPVVAVTATSYAEEALHRLGSYFTFTQMAGIPTGRLTDLLSTALQIAQPNYVIRNT